MTDEQKQIAETILQHMHEYDSDCHRDFGCSCGKLPMDDDDYEYGFYDSEYGPNPIVWACFGLPFKDAAMARHTASKSVWGQPVIVRRVQGSTEWEHV